MRARQLLDGASFDPASLQVIYQAFDQAWATIEHQYTDAIDAENARHYLANALLSVAYENVTDVGILREGALQALAGTYGNS